MSNDAEQSLIELAQHIALDNYGIGAEVKKLSGYDDHNFLVTRENDTKYVLKLSEELAAEEIILAQHAVLEQLQNIDRQYRFPRVIKDKNGVTVSRIFNDGSNYLVRMLSYVEGAFFAEVEHSAELLHDFGTFLGKLDSQLLSSNPMTLGNRRLKWDLQHFMSCRKYLDAIGDAHERRLVAYYFMMFDELVSPALEQLRKSVIHSDANDWNVLVEKDRIAGIIDFGDMVYSITINELAIGLAYALMDKEELLEPARQIVKGYHEQLPLQEQELALLYYLVAARLCTTLVMASHHRKLCPGNTYISVSEVPARELLKRWHAINPLAVEYVFREVCGYKKKQVPTADVLLQKRDRHVSKALSVSYESPVYMTQASLQYMYDAEGNSYLDGVNNICHVGHCHPEVVQAGRRQMARLNTNTRYLYDEMNEYAERLCAVLPEPINKVFFVNSGSAASDLAIRLAMTHTGRKDVVVMEHGYHGNTLIGIDISAYKFEGKGGRGRAGYIHKTPIPDTYRGEFKADDTGAGSKYARQVRQILASLDEHSSAAAFISESIVGCGGQVVLPAGYLSQVYRDVRAHGGVCIVDEVQTGFGRVGEHFWGFQLQGVIPDIIIMGKPMGNGHPLAAVATTDEICDSFENGMEFFSSFGGNPVSCAIGKTVLDVIEEEGLQAHALHTGDYLKQELTKLKDDYPLIGEVRGYGFFLGMELVKEQHSLQPATETAGAVINAMKNKGIFLSTDGPYNSVIKFKPPMCFSMENAERLVETFDEVLRAIST